ncbi:MAG: hypothetical protein GEV06_17390 [Luteitalea sp.]|nr:hypothetical protein [Luteitalea sp.]
MPEAMEMRSGMDITRPPGGDVPLLDSTHARDEKRRRLEYQLDLLSTRDIDFDEILGQRVTVSVALPDDSTRSFNGYVTGYLRKDTPPPRPVDTLQESDHSGAPASAEVGLLPRTAPMPASDSALTPRERQVLQLLTEGHSYKTAAAELDLSIETIRFHIMHVYRKLLVHSKSEAVALAIRRGLVR